MRYRLPRDGEQVSDDSRGWTRRRRPSPCGRRRDAGELVEAASRGSRSSTRAQCGHPRLVRQGPCHRRRSRVAGRPVPRRAVPVKDAVATRPAIRPLRHAGAEGHDWHEATDTWLAERFRAAGFVFLGKTNLPELATSVTTEPLAYGATHNPWNLDHSPGGSSGGAAAAVAAGMVAVAHGNDMGGSIRVPSRVRARRAQAHPRPHDARTRLRRVLGRSRPRARARRDRARHRRRARRDRGPGPGDPYTAPPPVPPVPRRGRRRPRPAAHRLPHVRRRRRRRTPTASPRSRRRRVLEELGHDVEPADVPALDHPSLTEAVRSIFSVFMARDLDRWSGSLGRGSPRRSSIPGTRPWRKSARTIAPRVSGGARSCEYLPRGLAEWWADGWDILVTPQ